MELGVYKSFGYLPLNRYYNSLRRFKLNAFKPKAVKPPLYLGATVLYHDSLKPRLLQKATELQLTELHTAQGGHMTHPEGQLS